MAKFAVLVEYDLPAPGQAESFEGAVQPLLDALRALTPIPPVSVSAYMRDAAERVIEAGKVAE